MLTTHSIPLQADLPLADERRDLQVIREISASYDSPLIRAYCFARFRIIRCRFLQEIRQFLPRNGTVLEVGCGFGLFALFFARTCPWLTITGFDINEARIALARRSAERLGLRNVTFSVADACSYHPRQGYDGAYLLDVLHHIPRAAVPVLIRRLHACLREDAVLVVKDVDTRPAYKMWFTWALDVLMTRGELPEYWPSESLAWALRDCGFRVFSYAMVDVLPYPHRLFLCPRAELGGLVGARMAG